MSQTRMVVRKGVWVFSMSTSRHDIKKTPFPSTPLMVRLLGALQNGQSPDNSCYRKSALNKASIQVAGKLGTVQRT